MGTSHHIQAVEIDLDRVLWDAEYRRRVIESLKRGQVFPADNTPPLNRDRAPTQAPGEDRGTDPAKHKSAWPTWTK